MKVKTLRSSLITLEMLNGLLYVRTLDRYKQEDGEKIGVFKIERTMHSRAGKSYKIVWIEENRQPTYYSVADINDMTIAKEETIIGIFKPEGE